MKKITSPSNPTLRAAVKLRERRAREKANLFGVEGLREAVQAVSGGFEVDHGFVCPELLSVEGQIWFAEHGKDSSKWLEVTPDCFRKLAVREGSDGIFLVCQRQFVNPIDRTKENPYWIVLDGVEKPGNIGAILRSADAAGVDGVWLSPGSDPFNPNLIRASLGAVFRCPLEVALRDDILNLCRKKQVPVVSTFLNAKTVSYTQFPFADQGAAIVLGSEAEGVDAFWLDHSDANVSIPMHGTVNSLNVSVAASILMFHYRTIAP